MRVAADNSGMTEADCKDVSPGRLLEIGWK